MAKQRAEAWLVKTAVGSSYPGSYPGSEATGAVGEIGGARAGRAFDGMLREHMALMRTAMAYADAREARGW